MIAKNAWKTKNATRGYGANSNRIKYNDETHAEKLLLILAEIRENISADQPINIYHVTRNSTAINLQNPDSIKSLRLQSKKI